MKRFHMRPKLTEYLLEKEYVTEDQCSEALQRQVIFGGRIGSNLQELYYVTEEQLLEALQHTHHIPIADPEKLKEIDPSIIREIPEDLARKYKITPFESPKGRVHLAMTDPANMGIIDEISFITGKVIKPFVTTEMKMTFLLEQYYGIQRERRFISIPEEEKKRRKEWEEKKKKKAEEELAAQERAEKEKIVSSEESPETQVSSPAVVSAPQPALDLNTFQGASQGLSQAQNRDDIANTLLAFANFRLERAILFIIKGEQIEAWKVGGVWKTPEHVGKIRFPFNDPTLIFNVANSNQSYKGPLLEVDTHKKIIGTLGAPYPKEAVAFPLAIRKRVFSVLYGDNAISSDPFPDLQELKKIVLKAALSFEILILKAKILFQ